MSGPAAGRWVLPLGPRPGPALRLFCFPHAGSGASLFRAWPEQLPPEIVVLAVQPPGREERWAEPPYPRLQPLVGALVSALRPHLVPPYAFFGHSMGALLAFEVSRQLRDTGAELPVHLIVSGRRAPTAKPLAPGGRGVGMRGEFPLSDAELLARLRAYEGTPGELLANEEVLRFLLPTLRADFTLCETYRYEPAPPLPCPVTAFGGDADPEVSLDELRAWREQTTGPFTVRVFPGGHFYHRQCPALFFAALSQALTARWSPPPESLHVEGGAVDVWRAPLDVPADALPRLAAVCSAGEQIRAASFATAALRADFLVARGYLRHLLARYLGVSPADVPLVIAPSGKPQIGGLPEGRLEFNLSHSGRFLLAAVTRGAEIGVDVEQVRPMPDAERLAETFFAPRERAELALVEAARREEALFACWTRKEAYLKARGDGLSFGLDRFAVPVAPDAVARLLWVDGEPDAPARWRLADLDVAPGYRAAAAVRRPDVQWRLWDLAPPGK